MNYIKRGFISVNIVALIVGAYVLGGRSAQQPQMPVSSEPKNLEEVVKLESDFERQQQELSNRLSDVKNRLKTVKLNIDLDERQSELESSELAKQIIELDEALLEMKLSGSDAEVPFPVDSPAGKLQNQPRSDSGIPLSVLQNYEKETGVRPEEIEELMRRTK